MSFVLDHPPLLFVLSLVIMWVATRLGVMLSKWHHSAENGTSEVFGVLQGATLTLLALILGFSFSMSISRYDQRKNYEEAEANAIGTEYVRLDLLAPAQVAKAKALLVDYLHQRILFYQTSDGDQLRQIDARTSQLQSDLWAQVLPQAREQPNAVTALVVSGMNDVLNAAGYTQAAWWNRIPASAWVFMLAIAVGSNLLVGYGARTLTSEPALLLVLPLAVAVSFMLIADIDSPRGGVIHVTPQNLVATGASLPQP